MSYNPKNYAEFFPRGYFGFDKKSMKTWNDSHELFARNKHPFKKRSEKVAEGLVLKTGHIKQKKGFSNYKIFEIDLKKRKIDISVSELMIYPLDAHKKLGNPLLLTNLGYFYLTTYPNLDPIGPPKIKTGNMVIVRGKVTNLPVVNRSAFIKLVDGKVELDFVRARGKAKLSDGVYDWVGSLTSYKKEGRIVVYTSNNLKLDWTIHPVIGPFRKAVKTYVKPSSKTKLAVCKLDKGRLMVSEITKKKILLNDKYAILEFGSNINLRKNEYVEVLSIDNRSFENIQSAVSIGPMIMDSAEDTLKQAKKEMFAKDMSTPSNPHRKNLKLARGCLVKLSGRKLALILIDGIPQVADIYPGVTLEELVAFVNTTYPKHKVAVCTDPSSTMKAVYTKDGKVEIFGNLHYLAYKQKKGGVKKFWPNGKLGRKINSMLVVR